MFSSLKLNVGLHVAWSAPGSEHSLLFLRDAKLNVAFVAVPPNSCGCPKSEAYFFTDVTIEPPPERFFSSWSTLQRIVPFVVVAPILFVFTEIFVVFVAILVVFCKTSVLSVAISEVFVAC